jgi:fatty acid desaturase
VDGEAGGGSVSSIRVPLSGGLAAAADETDPVARSLLGAVAIGGPWWRRYELPNWLVAVGVYGSWIALVMLHAVIPWPLLMILAAYVLAWHFSLQHEAIHSWRSAPLLLRTAVVWPPIGGWFPYELYRRGHSIHHRDNNLTYPGLDTESVYHRAEDWERYSKTWRAILMFNQTMLGRLTIGPALRLRKLVITEFGLLKNRDYRNVLIWARFFVGLAVVLSFVKFVGHMPIWQYYVLFVYPGLSLGLLRAFIEHRWGDSPEERVAVVESNWVFGLLFLWNNIHIVHHIDPALPWYDIPRVYRADKEGFLKRNGAYMFPGYGHIARRWGLRPVFTPVHPHGSPK